MNNIHTTYELRSILCYAMYAHHLVATRTDGEELSADWAKVYNTTPLSLKITLVESTVQLTRVLVSKQYDTTTSYSTS